MNKPVVAKHAKLWTAPKLVALGKIADVAGNPPGFCQGGGNKCQAGS